jgi:hypothetical protein
MDSSDKVVAEMLHPGVIDQGLFKSRLGVIDILASVTSGAYNSARLAHEDEIRFQIL